MRLIIFGLVSFALTCSAYAQQQVTVTIASAFPADTPPDKGAQRLHDELQKLGQVRVSAYLRGALGSEQQVLQGVQAGAAQIGVVSTLSLTTVNRDFGVFSLPFIFEDLGFALRSLDSPVGKDLLQSLDKTSLRGLAYWPVGMVQLFAKKSVHEANDIKGLKIVASQSSKRVLDSIGASTPAVSFAEVYTAIAQGAVDASATTPIAAGRMKLQEVLPFVNATNQQFQAAVLITNRSFWNGLPDNLRAELTKIVQRITPEVDVFAIEQASKEIERMRGLGLKIVVPSSAAFKTWRSTASEAWSKEEINKSLVQAAALSGGAEGGGDPCPLNECRCTDRTCKASCCNR